MSLMKTDEIAKFLAEKDYDNARSKKAPNFIYSNINEDKYLSIPAKLHSGLFHRRWNISNANPYLLWAAAFNALKFNGINPNTTCLSLAFSDTHGEIMSELTECMLNEYDSWCSVNADITPELIDSTDDRLVFNDDGHSSIILNTDLGVQVYSYDEDENALDLSTTISLIDDPFGLHTYSEEFDSNKVTAFPYILTVSTFKKPVKELLNTKSENSNIARIFSLPVNTEELELKLLSSASIQKGGVIQYALFNSWKIK